jgi:hypothetical protein
VGDVTDYPCKLEIYRSKGQYDLTCGLWYVTCDKHQFKPPPGLDGKSGRKTWALAFALGVSHQDIESWRRHDLRP